MESLQEVDDQIQHAATVKANVLALRQETEKLEKYYSIVSSCFQLTPVKLVDSMIAYESIGPCPAACIFVVFEPIPGDNNMWSCDIQLQEDLFKKFTGRPLKSVTPLFQASIHSLAAKASHMTMRAPEIVSYLHELHLKLNRLHQTARELASLKQRYSAMLFIEDDSKLLFEVNFANTESPKTLTATFEVTEAYPFSFVTVEVDGDVDLDSVQTLLKRNAQKGFGYLSRTCDLLAAHFRCEVESTLTRRKGS